MNYIVHTVGAIGLASGISEIGMKMGVDVAPAIFAGAIIGGLVPDIDSPKSLLGKYLRPISSLIEESIGHRTFFHSVFFLTIACSMSLLVNKAFGVGIAIGISSHILLDMLTPGTYGVALFYPMKKERWSANGCYTLQENNRYRKIRSRK